MKHKLNLTLVLAFLCGCASFHNTAGKLLVSTAQTVDATMKGWATWVVSGQTKPEQETAVKAAYGQYQFAMQAAQTAYLVSANNGDKSVWQKASLALQASSGSLVQLVQSFQIGSK